MVRTFLNNNLFFDLLRSSFLAGFQDARNGTAVKDFSVQTARVAPWMLRTVLKKKLLSIAIEAGKHIIDTDDEREPYEPGSGQDFIQRAYESGIAACKLLETNSETINALAKVSFPFFVRDDAAPASIPPLEWIEVMSDEEKVMSFASAKAEEHARRVCRQPIMQPLIERGNVGRCWKLEADQNVRLDRSGFSEAATVAGTYYDTELQVGDIVEYSHGAFAKVREVVPVTSIARIERLYHLHGSDEQFEPKEVLRTEVEPPLVPLPTKEERRAWKAAGNSDDALLANFKRKMKESKKVKTSAAKAAKGGIKNPKKVIKDPKKATGKPDLKTRIQSNMKLERDLNSLDGIKG